MESGGQIGEPEKPGFSILKDKRVRLGLTQQQVADIASINIRLYQRLESGERQINRTSFCIGVAIADVLELDVHELVSTPTVEAYLKEKNEYRRLTNQGEIEKED